MLDCGPRVRSTAGAALVGDRSVIFKLNNIFIQVDYSINNTNLFRSRGHSSVVLAGSLDWTLNVIEKCHPTQPGIPRVVKSTTGEESGELFLGFGSSLILPTG